LNPDEALHYLLFDQQSAFLAYKASLSNAHPPLVFLVLYFWHFLGHSELMLRLPSVFAGTAFCWFTFKWMQISFSKAASLIALIIVAFSPTLIGLSAELREYSLLLFFMAAALYYFEAAIQERAPRKMVYFTVAFYLAILSHYSAVFFVLAMGLYALARIADAPLPRKLIATWAIGQVGAAAIYGFLYVTHISKLKGVIPQWAGPYNRFYFHGGFADIFGFLREYTPYIFSVYFWPNVHRPDHVFALGHWCRDSLCQGPDAGPRLFALHPVGYSALAPLYDSLGAAVASRYPYIPAATPSF